LYYHENRAATQHGFLFMDLEKESRPLEFSKMVSRNLFVIIFIFVLAVSIVFNGGLYFSLNWLSYDLFVSGGRDALMNNMPAIIDRLGWVSGNFYFGIVPAITGMFLILGVMLWFVLGRFTTKMMGQIQIGNQKTFSREKPKVDFVDHKIEQDRKRRLFLHNLSVLQREGRLLDFFAEDLSRYEDDQIGAAVRSIQEDCKKAIKKYIDPKPVIDKEEGETITIEPEFDMDSITLVGKVTGALPFKGILKHRGWKAGKNEIPKLSDVRDASVIIPAEVEIQ
jgi:hypothetical protein